MDDGSRKGDDGATDCCTLRQQNIVSYMLLILREDFEEIL
jgi:hypothetical protein